MSYPLPTNPLLAALLQRQRDNNKLKSSKCAICKEPSVGINAIKHKVIFVCQEHLEEPEDCILDTSMPGVLHYIYPNGKKPGLMDPNVGGWRGNK